ncbi:MAG: hypothetical protein IK077_01995, partial [Thermoguttaceae bacterium]|nr:hypothetical protein [Thermoguttaceae bacterium]
GRALFGTAARWRLGRPNAAGDVDQCVVVTLFHPGIYIHGFLVGKRGGAKTHEPARSAESRRRKTTAAERGAKPPPKLAIDAYNIPFYARRP